MQNNVKSSTAVVSNKIHGEGYWEKQKTCVQKTLIQMQAKPNKFWPQLRGITVVKLPFQPTSHLT